MALSKREGANATRSNLLVAARKSFIDQGVNSSSLDRIAARAGVTRGAIYYHFSDKTQLFLSVLKQSLRELDEVLRRDAERQHFSSPLDQVEWTALRIFQEIRHNAVLQQVLQIVFFRCEYVGELKGVRSFLQEAKAVCLNYLERCYAEAVACALVRPGFSPRELSRDSYCFFHTLLMDFLEGKRQGPEDDPEESIRQHLALRQPLL